MTVVRGSNDFICGYAAALADLNRQHDQPTMVNDVLEGAGLNLHYLEQAGVEQHDLLEILKCQQQGTRSQVEEANAWQQAPRWRPRRERNAHKSLT